MAGVNFMLSISEELSYQYVSKVLISCMERLTLNAQWPPSYTTYILMLSWIWKQYLKCKSIKRCIHQFLETCRYPGTLEMLFLRDLDILPYDYFTLPYHTYWLRTSHDWYAKSVRQVLYSIRLIQEMCETLEDKGIDLKAFASFFILCLFKHLPPTT